MAEIVKPETHVPTTNGSSTKNPTVKVESKSVYPDFQAPPHLPRPPFIDVDGIPNFRDIGGYLCSPYGQKDTHIVRPSFVYRCAVPTSVASNGASQLLQDLNVTAIYDLRSAPEVNRTPSFNNTTLKSLHRFTPVYESEDYSPDALARKLKWYSSPNNTDIPTNNDTSIPTVTPSPEADLPPFSLGFLNAYRDISTYGASAYRTIFTHILSRPSSPLVFHCTAGKDRTGVLAALMLRLAGVDDDTICWEYALTEPGLGIWRDVFMQRIAKNGLGSHSPSPAEAENEVVTKEEAARICGSRSGNMRAFLRLVLDGEFGGAEKYMIDRLGFSAEEVERIRSALVVPRSKASEGEVVGIKDIPGWTPEGGVTDAFQRLPSEGTSSNGGVGEKATL